MEEAARGAGQAWKTSLEHASLYGVSPVPHVFIRISGMEETGELAVLTVKFKYVLEYCTTSTSSTKIKGADPKTHYDKRLLFVFVLVSSLVVTAFSRVVVYVSRYE